MARIELVNLNHRYDSHKGAGGFAIEDLHLTWEDGTANALLGPSGCGKTTLLNILSGLLLPTSGQVLFDGVDVTRKSTRARHIAQVFQFPVVYDAMTVFENLAFPLRNSGVAHHTIAPRVGTIAALLGIEELLRRKARGLTPAEKQKVSLGRGLVREDTAAVLFDEPLTIIDPQEKWELRRSLREVQRELKMTMIYVTHDQHEALTFADHVTVMKDGAVMQTGTPGTLHRDPATPFVGFFIGSPGMNFLSAQREGAMWRVGTMAVAAHSAKIPGDSALVGIRPEFVEVLTEAAENTLGGTIGLIEDTGIYKVLTLHTGVGELKARVPEGFSLTEDSNVWVRFNDGQAKIFPPEPGRVTP